jgi:hypothetical protein
VQTGLEQGAEGDDLALRPLFFSDVPDISSVVRVLQLPQCLKKAERGAKRALYLLDELTKRPASISLNLMTSSVRGWITAFVGKGAIIFLPFRNY